MLCTASALKRIGVRWTLQNAGGEKQKILFLCVLLKKAKLYIFDEPSAGLDNSSVELLKNCICKIAKQSIVIIVTHDENLCSICDVLYEL